ncbi:hypothetical protein GQ600_22677 [Phytophthora cactorum]|nr:hypothetical protein GQ600_22677 [Phytophthora cactorum]
MVGVFALVCKVGNAVLFRPVPMFLIFPPTTCHLGSALSCELEAGTVRNLVAKTKSNGKAAATVIQSQSIAQRLEVETNLRRFMGFWCHHDWGKLRKQAALTGRYTQRLWLTYMRRFRATLKASESETGLGYPCASWSGACRNRKNLSRCALSLNE